MSIAIVTDSTADIPANIVEERNIHVIPAILVIDGKSIEDGHGISRREFYECLPHMEIPPTTATPAMGTFEKCYQQLFEQGFQEIVSVHVSSLLSGITNTAQMAAQAFGKRIRVIDSQSLSMGLGFQVLAAAEAAIKGLSLDKIVQHVDGIRQRLRVFAMLDTLEYVRRSGRVSWARAQLGSLLRIKPFLEVREGKVFNIGQARTRRKGTAHLLEILKSLGELERLAVLHTNAEEDARQFLLTLNPQLSIPALIVNVTTIVGTHVGPNGLGFAAIMK
jgi:DegV family protein with EDD domain